MSEDEEKLSEALSRKGLFTLLSITPVNHKPHPFVIGGRHVSFAANNFGGGLGVEAIEAAERKGIYCAHPNCRLPYKEHTYDTVAFIKLTRHATNAEATEALKDVDGVVEISGFSFVETPEQFRITEERPDTV